MFNTMDDNKDLTIDKHEFISFFKRAGNQDLAQKITQFIGDKQSFNLEEFQAYWAKEIEKGQSETVLVSILTRTMEAHKPVEMSVQSILATYNSQTSLRESLKQHEVKSNMKKNAKG